jgi:peptidyl-prolyl cis-trans isomerase B (cyclophilin B)
MDYIKDPDTVKATILFTNGKRAEFLLHPSAAPKTAENFISLAKSGFYDGLCFHRVVKDFVIQGGGYTVKNGRLYEKKAPDSVTGEFSSNGVENGLKHEKGTLSMARLPSKPDSATSQFFICLSDLPYLDGEYAAFGKAAGEESLKIIDQIGRVNVARFKEHEHVPEKPVEIQMIMISDR